MVVPAWEARTWEAEAGDGEFKASLGCWETLSQTMVTITKDVNNIVVVVIKDRVLQHWSYGTQRWRVLYRKC